MTRGLFIDHWKSTVDSRADLVILVKEESLGLVLYRTTFSPFASLKLNRRTNLAARLQGTRYTSFFLRLHLHLLFILFVPSKVRCRKQHVSLLPCSLSDGKQIHDFVSM